MAVQRDGQAASLRGFGKRGPARLPAAADSPAHQPGAPRNPGPKLPPANLRSVHHPRCGKPGASRRAPIPLRVPYDTPPGDENLRFPARRLTRQVELLPVCPSPGTIAQVSGMATSLDI